VQSLDEAITLAELVFYEWPGDSPDMLGAMRALRAAGVARPPIAVVLIVDPRSSPVLERARSFGAVDALLMPPHVTEIRAEILDARGALEGKNAQMSQRLRALQESILIGESDAFLRAVAEIPLAAASEANVLLQGETGTGKEMFARAIHELSSRSGPYIAVNCAGLAPTLTETELFGHAKGSFTGAVRDHAGRFEAVGAGTLLLDEIGDIDIPLQMKLLRVIEERRFQRVGGTHAQEFRGRLIAATSVDLAQAVKEKRFRPDLLGRLNQIQIRIPPLRERRGDVPVLAEHFLAKHAKARPLRISYSAMRVMQDAQFPMNVRQVENAIVAAIARCGDSDVILPRHLPEEMLRATGSSTLQSYEAARETALRNVDQIYLGEAMARHGGNQSAASAELGIDRKTFAARWKAQERLDEL
jgi:DNA-binding NtrC family response regulator